MDGIPVLSCRQTTRQGTLAGGCVTPDLIRDTSSQAAAIQLRLVCRMFPVRRAVLAICLS